MIVHATYTDTFSGELNYSWVREVEFEVPNETSNLAVIRRAKKELGITGAIANKNSYQSMDEIVQYYGTTAMVIGFELE